MLPRRESSHPTNTGLGLSTRFGDAGEVDAYWRDNADELRKRTVAFSEALFDTTLPPEALEAVTANLSIMLSPTVLRLASGDLWGWEGCSDAGGCCMALARTFGTTLRRFHTYFPNSSAACAIPSLIRARIEEGATRSFARRFRQSLSGIIRLTPHRMGNSAESSKSTASGG